MRKILGKSGGAGTLLVTLFIVTGIAVAVFASRGKSQKMAPSEQTTAKVASIISSDAAVLVVTEEGAHLIQGDRSKRVLWPEDEAFLGQPLATLVGADVMTGERVTLENGFARQPLSVFVSPDGRRDVRAANRRRDGTSSVEMRYGNQSTIFVLRLPNGTGLRDAKPLGWFDDETIALEGLSTSSRAIFILNLNGRVKHLTNLPAYIEHLSSAEGAVWYVLVSPGAGLEDPSQPPSELKRIGSDGRHETMAVESEKVIGRYVVGPLAAAYVDGEGEAYVVRATGDLEVFSLGQVQPLLFSGGRLIYRRDRTGVVYDVATKKEAPLLVDMREGAALLALPKGSIDE